MLTHYIIVRRDMPLGVVCAQVTHAAGESYARYAAAYGIEDSQRTVVVVLGTSSERRLKTLERRLLKAGFEHVAIREPDLPWNNALMAIGLYPAKRETVSKLVKDFDPLSQLLDAGVADRTMHPTSKGI